VGRTTRQLARSDEGTVIPLRGHRTATGEPTPRLNAVHCEQVQDHSERDLNVRRRLG
jgi:hypothetical protein